MEEYADGAEGTSVSAVEAADDHTPRISVRKRTTDGEIVFAPQPETDEQFAIVRPAAIRSSSIAGTTTTT